MANFKKNLIKDKRAFGIRPWIISLILVVVFSLFLLDFAYSFLTIKNPNSQILSDYGLNNSINKLNNSLSGFNELSNNIKNTMASAETNPVSYLFLIFQGAFEIPKTILNFALAGITVITDIAFPALGGTGLGAITTTLMNVMIIILTITLVVLTIQFIRSGQSER